MGVDEWNGEVTASLEKLADLNHRAEQTIGYLDSIRMPNLTPDNVFGNRFATEYSPATPKDMLRGSLGEGIEHVTPENARANERSDEEWAAGKMYFLLGDHVSVKRCAKELERELEWEAAAQLYVLEEDMNSVDRCIKNLLEADMVTRAHGVIQFAVEQEKWAVVDHCLTERGWRIEGVIPEHQLGSVLQSMARAGREKHLRDYVVKQILTWRNAGHTDNGLPEDILQNIVVLGDLSLARQYLEVPGSNVGFVYWCGEGEGIAPLSNLAAFYRLISSKPALRELFEERTHDFVRDIETGLAHDSGDYEHPSSFKTKGIQCDMYQLSWELWRWLTDEVTPSPELTKLWARELSAGKLPEPGRMVSLWILIGEKPVLSPDMEVSDRMLVAILNKTPLSKAVSPDEITYKEGWDLPIPFNLLAEGEFPRESGMKLWQAYGLPTATVKPGAVYSTDAEVEEALVLAERMDTYGNDRGVRKQVISDLAISGFLDRIPEEWRILGIVPWIAAEKGDMGPMTKVLLRTMEDTFKETSEAYEETKNGIRRLLSIPLGREARVVLTPKPEGDGLYAMLKPHLESLQQLSEHTYLHFMASSPPEVRVAEVRRLAASGQARLANQLLGDR
jgi:hypothetical protein